MESVGRELLRLDEKYREELYASMPEESQSSPKISEDSSSMKTLKGQVAKVSDRYYRHIVTGARLSAIEPSLSILTKSFRDA